MDKTIFENIEKFVQENKDAMFRDIGRLVAVNSVMGESEKGAPFGRGPADALALALEIARELGLETRNCEDMMGYAQIGEGEDYLATITHLDVVPAGEGWTGDPFTMREREGYIIGRGVMDDKGPSVICLYALKYLKENCAQLRYPVRALLGVNEENGMGDLDYYLKNYPAPLFCLSPDANFPVCNGEKGIFHGRIVSNFETENIVDIKGGVAANVVPAKCEAWVRAEELESAGRVSVQRENGLWHITAEGIGGHASLPEGTVNAIGVMVNYLLENNVVHGKEAELMKLISLLNESYDGSALGVAADDGRFSPLTIVGGVIGVENGRIFQTIDSRYPTNTSGGKIAAAIKAKAGDTAEVVTDSDKAPFYMDENNPAVRVCMEAYTLVTGEKAELYTMGGGTYARAFPNAAAFGPEHPERPMPDFAGPIHGADESACMDYFIETLKIYITALLKLENTDF